MKEFFQKVWNSIKSIALKIWAFMKSNKLISCLIAGVLVIGIALAIILPATIGNNNGSSNNQTNSGETTSYDYQISVENQTGYGLKGVTVTLKDGDAEVATATTNSNGNANFSDVDAGIYDIELSNLPKGYVMQENATYKTMAQTGTKISVPLTPTGVIMEEVPNGYAYKLGDVMYDFSIQTSDGATFTLSEVLKEKEMVLLNFWATWCGPCQAEFPAMNSAAISYADTVSVLAVSTTDDKASVANYKQTSGLTFNMANDSIGIQHHFNTTSIPLSVIIDRFGVITFMHTGSMEAMSDFTARFDLFSGEDYISTVVPGDGKDYIDPNQPVVEILKPNVPAPSLADVKEVMGGSDEFTYSWNENEYSWPWVIGEDEEGKYLYTPITNIHSSYATLIIDFEAKAGTALQFDYYVSSEDYDKFYVMVDGGYAHSLSGAFNSAWKTCTAYTFDETLVGKHQVTLIYYKDSETSAGDDIVKIRNLRFVDMEELNNDDVDVNIFRNASWGLNEAGAATQYKYYAEVVYNDVDGYYHVNSVDGPILFASIMTVNNWNTYGLWDLAYNEKIIDEDGFNYSSNVEAFAWEANNNLFNHGYTPVTEDLRILLDVIVSIDVYGEKYDCDYHENEWLELCSYYDHYGNTPQVEDPLKGITFHAAIPLQEGSNDINVPFAINPRGFKYKFTPEKSGVYNFYSTGDYDTVAFFADEPNHIIAEYDDLVTAEAHVDENGVTVRDGNFRFYQYLEAGHTYYVLCTTFLDVTARYNLEVKYIGETFKYLENAATGPHTFHEETGETFLPSISFEYADPAKTYTYAETGETTAGDGYYRVKNTDGSLGSIIYVDLNRPTPMFQSYSIFDIVREAEKSFADDETKRYFYIDGHDYTIELKQLCFTSTMVSGELHGFAAVDAEVYKLLSIIMKAYLVKSEGNNASNNWLLLCYYYNYLG